ncbi:MAG: hypothetical protein P9L97_10365 [Candidatus Tenebribacter davisii]|nr:hypothetical protein [Candidatus Tenebribacter davisii]
MKKLEVVMTSNLQRQIDPDLCGSLLVILIPLFAQYPCDMFIVEPGQNNKLQIRLAGYSFITNELDEETIISRTEMVGEKVIWFKVDDYQNRYVGTLLLPEDY